MYVVYVVDKQDKIILNHHYQRYFHLEENKNRNIENLIKKKSKESD